MSALPTGPAGAPPAGAAASPAGAVPASSRHSRLEAIWLGLVPFAVILALWTALPRIADYPAYKLPPVSAVLAYAWESVLDGTLFTNIGASLARLAAGFVIGMALAVPLGLAIALNRHVADMVRPVLSFLQAIAGIAWVPLTIIWFGIGNGSVIFVIANTIFFATLYNTVLGVETIPLALHRAVRSHGGHGLSLITNLVLPGAFMQILLGMRTSVAYGWRALVASEMIAGSNGLGYMTIDAVQWQRVDVIVLGMIVIGLLWMAMDRLLFVPLERRTVMRWGLMQR